MSGKAVNKQAPQKDKVPHHDPGILKIKPGKFGVKVNDPELEKHDWL